MVVVVVVMLCHVTVDLMCVAVFYEWEAEHGPLSGWQLIEPIDGFHPNQVCHSVLSSDV